MGGNDLTAQFRESESTRSGALRRFKRKRSKPFSKSPASRIVIRKRNSGFFKRHGKAISFVGMFIVILTFISKETLREHWRDLADANKRAEEISSIRRDIKAALNSLSYEQETIGKIANWVSQQDPDDKFGMFLKSNLKEKVPGEDYTYQELKDRADESGEIIQTLGSTMRNLVLIKDVVQLLPDHAEKEKEYRSLMSVKNPCHCHASILVILIVIRNVCSRNAKMKRRLISL
jgi:uncharacterized membrane protein YheB (UPF0754 family)